MLLRPLDCLVIETLHDYNKQQDRLAFDSVRGAVFLFPGMLIKDIPSLDY